MKSEITRRVLKDFQILMASTYGLPLEVDIVELPVGETDSEARELPIVYIEGRLVARGDIPSLADLVEAVFKLLEDTLAIPKVSGFPILESTMAEE